MWINPIPADIAFTINRRGIYYAMAMSLCVHIVAYYVLYWPLALPSYTTPKMPPPMRVQIRRAGESSRITHEAHVLKEVSVLSNRLPDLTTTSTSKIQKPLTAPQKPRIDSESIRSAIGNLDNTKIAEKGLSGNGAIVINAELLALLNQSERRKGIVADDQLAKVDSTFSGGQWTDFLRMGDKCFRVTQGNPFYSIPQEMWYRVKCSP
jgi:hypothetical protein